MDKQLILGNVLRSQIHRRFWDDTLVIPPCAAIASGVFLFGHALLLSRPLKNCGARIFNSSWEEIEETGGLPSDSRAQDHLHRHGGLAIFLNNLVRTTGSLALLGLGVTTFFLVEQNNGIERRVNPVDGTFPRSKWMQAAMCLTFVYTSMLGLVSIRARPTVSRLATRHMAFVFIITLGVYSFRDLWPLAKINRRPLDEDEGWILWLKIGILALIAVVLPLVIPRQYTPLDPKDPNSEPNTEQTSSILSLVLYSYLDPLIALASTVPHLAASALPPIADYDKANNLVKKSFLHLDPFRGGKRQHIFWGILKVFRREFAILSIMLVIKVLFEFASPIGINRLLNFLENPEEDEIIRPWVWIAWLFVGPTVSSIAFQWHNYISTRTVVQTEGILTQLIFEHALRIRMKAETSDETSDGVHLGSGTPVDGVSITAEADDGSSTSQHETLKTSSISGTSATTVSHGKQQKDATSVEETPSRQPKLSSANNLVGRINNLVTTDLGNIADAKEFLLILIEIPLQISLSIWFLYAILGWSALVGMGVMIVLFPVPGYITKLLQSVEAEVMKQTDARVQAVSETMSVLRMVKMFGWERKMEARVAEKRDIELKWVWKRQVLNLWNSNIHYAIPTLTMLATFSIYTLVMKQELTASRVFSSITVFDMLRGELHTIFFKIGPVVQGKVSLDRVNEYLHNTELLDSFTEKKSEVYHSQELDIDHEIGFRAASFTWSNNNDSNLPPSKREFNLQVRGEVIFKQGCTNLIVGPTGSGKTSMLMALLGEMHFVPLDDNAWFRLPRQPGRVAYAAQESWVQNESIRENIVFGAPFDEVRYKQVIHQCGLQRDLALFEAGDQTEVGEKGLTLSGGQKARVTLARAVYSSADVLLLDDILSALDVHTARWVVEKCLAGDLLHGRTVLLVTHNISMTSSLARRVISIGLDGVITVEDSFSKNLANNLALSIEAKENEDVAAKEQEAIDVPKPDQIEVKGGKLTVAEEISEGNVSWSSVEMLTTAMGGRHPFVFWAAFLAGVFLTDLIETVQTWFLGYWASQYEKPDASEVNVPYYLIVYCLFTVFITLTYTLDRIVYFMGSLRASRIIHKDLVHSVLGTTLRWLDTTPTSRVMARCTQDIKAVDSRLPNMLTNIMDLSTTILVRLGAIVVLTPIFLIPGVLVALFGAICGQFYLKAQLSVKREMSNARSPVIAHFGAAIAGLTSIRAYGAQKAFEAESLCRIDRYTRTARLFYNLNRWICIRIDAMGAMFAAALASYLVYGRSNSTASDTGFSLAMAVSFSNMILWWVGCMNTFEVSGNSLERIQGFVNIEQEPKATEGGNPPAYWPASGDLVVENLSARYSQDGPKVLDDISFQIKSGERVGVVGRTGSGKSSLTLSLLRCIYTEGTVYYAGMPTNSINLEALRSNITIIPQIPELLSGTLRANLDPFSEYEDAALNDALRCAGLSSLQMQAEGNKLMLDTPISSGGGNLSVGQKQILALARAILRGSKLLILDEATSAIDYQTDDVIQSSLRQELSSDVTVITVAHRLQTVMDADKIMVLDAGRIAEFDSPQKLLQTNGSWLRALVDESSDRDLLYAMAEGKAVALREL